jgi:hypothetical protein
VVAHGDPTDAPCCGDEGEVGPAAGVLTAPHSPRARTQPLGGPSLVFVLAMSVIAYQLWSLS